MNIPWRQAIEQVLRQNGQAMHYAEIAEVIVQQGLRTDVGATPSATVGALISSEIKKDGNQSPFQRIAPGTFILKDFGGTTNPVPAEVEQQSESQPAGLIQAFGMYWNKDMVEWTSAPKLLGIEFQGSTPVNFCDQLGVYILYDRHEVVYAGRSAERLGVRLREHTTDRLNGRWDRFSWFGLSQVTSEGKLIPLGKVTLSANTVIASLEALLIEGLEPKQNRKRGDEFKAIEYLQYQDPALRKKQVVQMITNL